jgi:hypothetical protein
MTISSIQKKKFLDNIYRLLYSTGTSTSDKKIQQPDEKEVKRQFDLYFSSNRIGAPLSVDYNQLRNSGKTNPELMNILMSRSLLNMEVLYDSVHENNESLMNVVTILNKRLDQLKNKRISLEKKIDDILFSNSNTDGYFYSFSETFSNLDNIDLSLSSCFIDSENKKATLPKLKSSVFNFATSDKVNLSGMTYSIVFNGGNVIDNTPIVNPTMMSDGLNNTYTTIRHKSNTIGACAVIITVPLNTNFVISKVDGKLNTTSAITTVAELVDQKNSQFRRKQSNTDYDRFSFDFVPQSATKLVLTLIKYEPDVVNSGNLNKYEYNFNIRDLIISGQYYDKQASLVSSPISISSGNDNKIIDAVSIEASNDNKEVGDIKFFVAQDLKGAVNISDFNWIPISSTSNNQASFDKIVSFNKSNKVFKKIKTSATFEEIALYPLSSTGSLSTLNPTTSIYKGINVYRIGLIPKENNPYNPYILDGTNAISFKYVSYKQSLYRDLDQWSTKFNDKTNSLQIFSPGNIQITNTPAIPINLNLSGISGFLQTNILIEEESTITQTISKYANAIDWDVAVYLNGVKEPIADLPTGLASKDVTWNFKKGINNIVITFDSVGNSAGTINLMDGVSIASFGTPFLNYYSYVDPFDFRSNRSIEDKVFTIDTYLNNKEILCRNRIQDDSRIVYLNNSENLIDSIRFRADFTRFGDPFGTPSLNGYRVKFKNSI